MINQIKKIISPKIPEQLIFTLEHVGGGIHKRTDENRELLELLQDKAPDLINECPWVVTWILSNDDVFSKLSELAPQLGANNPKFRKREDFPRQLKNNE